MGIYRAPKTRPTIKQASGGKSDSLTELHVFHVDDGDTVADLMMSNLIPRHGAYHPRYPLYRHDGASYTKSLVLPGPKGGYKFEVELTWKTREKKSTVDQDGNPITANTPPWKLPVEGYSTGASPIDESQFVHWERQGDGSFLQMPYRNTAGSMLTAVAPRYLFSVNFQYNVTPDYPDTFASSYAGKINLYPIMVCNQSYGIGHLQIANIGTQLMRDYDEDGKLKWTYKKVNVSLLADPQSFERHPANKGRFFRRGNERQMTQIWQVEGKDETGYFTKIAYGSRGEMLDKIRDGDKDTGSEDPKVKFTYSPGTLSSVTEEMFLTEDGTDVSPIDPETQLQKPVYLASYPYEPVDFSPLRLPMVL